MIIAFWWTSSEVGVKEREGETAPRLTEREGSLAPQLLL